MERIKNAFITHIPIPKFIKNKILNGFIPYLAKYSINISFKAEGRKKLSASPIPVHSHEKIGVIIAIKEKKKGR